MYDVLVRTDGRPDILVDDVDGRRADARKAATEAAKVWFPDTATLWNGDQLEVRMGGRLIARVVVKEAGR